MRRILSVSPRRASRMRGRGVWSFDGSHSPRYFLRKGNFRAMPFEPSAADVEELSIDDFNAKYEARPAYTIAMVEKVLGDMLTMAVLPEAIL